MNAHKTAAAVLIVSVIAGCATTETVYVQPECEVPGRPVLPEIESERLATLSDETFWALMDRERRLVDWALLLEATVKDVCRAD